MPVLEIQLAAEEKIIAVSGELSWMTSTIDLSTTTGVGGGGGLLGAFPRVVGGGSLFMTEYCARGGDGTVADKMFEALVRKIDRLDRSYAD